MGLIVTRVHKSFSFCKNYTVKSIIGKGGFGCVFKVLDKIDNWEYAVKRIAVRPVCVSLYLFIFTTITFNVINTCSLMESTLWEARVMAQLQHPGV